MKQAVKERSKVSPVEGTTFKAVAFTEPTGEDAYGLLQSETIHAGTFDSADEAWAAAKAK